MTDPVDTLMIDLRANTQGFAQDVAAMRGSFDGQLLDGFAKAGDVLERGLLSALRKGSLGFEDLKRIAFNVIDQIAAQAIRSLFASAPQGGSGGGGLGGLIGSLLGGGQTGGSGAGSGIGGLVGSILGSISGGSSGGSSGIDGLIGAISGIGSPQPAGGSSGGLGALIGAISGLPGRATGGAVSPERPFIVGERGPELFVPTSAGRVEAALPQAPRNVRVAITIAAPPGTSAPQALQRSSRQVASAVRRALGNL
ncbi:MAG TPA: tail tape measure protein [Novosphingobium sp.]|nr:tail tape measure protein [Novosphingobium sp.]HPZ45586.1 tail tape measure protein [Novosphingobium sp.]HQE00375.1 tail tape measure protein [Novosphingobium sp.]